MYSEYLKTKFSEIPFFFKKTNISEGTIIIIIYFVNIKKIFIKYKMALF